MRMLRDPQGQPEGAPISKVASPYGARLRATLDLARPTRIPPSWVLDKIADEQLSGKYTDLRNPVCTGCFTRKAANGSCYC